MKRRDYRDYLQDIIDSINDIESFTRNMGFEEFKTDRKTINAVVRSIEIIGEAAKRVPGALRGKYKMIPWKEMTRMRDKLIHAYFGVDTEILWKTIKDDVPPLKPLIQRTLEDLEK